jgi:hypothetical protein
MVLVNRENGLDAAGAVEGVAAGAADRTRGKNAEAQRAEVAFNRLRRVH